MLLSQSKVVPNGQKRFFSLSSCKRAVFVPGPTGTRGTNGSNGSNVKDPQTAAICQGLNSDIRNSKRQVRGASSERILSIGLVWFFWHFLIAGRHCNQGSLSGRTRIQMIPNIMSTGTHSPCLRRNLLAASQGSGTNVQRWFGDRDEFYHGHVMFHGCQRLKSVSFRGFLHCLEQNPIEEIREYRLWKAWRGPHFFSLFYGDCLQSTKGSLKSLWGRVARARACSQRSGITSVKEQMWKKRFHECFFY